MTTYTPTWILVADASRARIFRYDGFGIPMVLLTEWEHPESRARNMDLASDKPGRIMQAHVGPHPGKGSRSGMQDEQTPKAVEHEHFARRLAAELERGRAENAYGRLVLCASPEFLGILRQVISEQVRKLVVNSLEKDYTAMPLKDLNGYLAPVLQA